MKGLALSLKNPMLAGLFLAVCLMASAHSVATSADKLQLIATGQNKAIVLLNNERLVLSLDSKSHKRISLVSANSDEAVVSLDGETFVLTPSSVAAPVYSESSGPTVDRSKPLTLWADSSGFFFANGKINNRSVRFLVDTGANTVTFSSRDADRLGLNYKKGEDGYATTASGITPIKSFKVTEVSIEHIQMFNVRVTVIPGNFPDVPLLGGSFLNKLSMVREGRKMELTKRDF